PGSSRGHLPPLRRARPAVQVDRAHAGLDPAGRRHDGPGRVALDAGRARVHPLEAAPVTKRKVLGVEMPSQPPPRSGQSVLSEQEYSLLWRIHEDGQATARELAEVKERVDEHDEILITLRKERLTEAERGARMEAKLDFVGDVVTSLHGKDA